MKVGEKAILTCASDYAYGARGSPPKVRVIFSSLGRLTCFYQIPPNATLQFEVELFGFEEVESVDTDEERIEAAKKRRELGNEKFKTGDLQAAARAYEKVHARVHVSRVCFECCRSLPYMYANVLCWLGSGVPRAGVYASRACRERMQAAQGATWFLCVCVLCVCVSVLTYVRCVCVCVRVIGRVHCMPTLRCAARNRTTTTAPLRPPIRCGRNLLLQASCLCRVLFVVPLYPRSCLCCGCACILLLYTR